MSIFLKHISLYKKNLLALVILTMTIILFSMGMFFSIAVPQYKSLISIFYDVTEQSNVITMAIHDHDESALQNALTRIKANPDVLNAEFFSMKEGEFVKEGHVDSGSKSQKKINQLNRNEINMLIPFYDKGKPIGALEVRFSSGKVDFESILKISILIILIAMYISKILTDSILTPLLAFVETTEKIKKENNYSLRATKCNDDEIGNLVDSFNGMLDSIQAHDARQKLFYTHVGHMAATMKNITDKNDFYLRVKNADKTHDAIVQVLTDSFNTMLEKIQQYQKQLSLSERQAGMSDIATSTLHNVGNVLNSASTSLDMITEKVTQSKIAYLYDLIQLFKQHENNLAEFLTQDPKGKGTLDYLTLLFEQWKKEKNEIQIEINNSKKNIDVIQSIINTQNISNKAIEVSEKVNVAEIIEDAIGLLDNNISKSAITIHRDYASIPMVIIDRVKLLQVLINLIKNSFQSLSKSMNEKKEIVIALENKDEKHFIISIADNGIGIAADNMVKIFNQGFTTKKDGFGYGLHWSALATSEMHGQLNAASDGVEKGATFTLELPYQ